jgi:hypothetical protein
MSNYFDDDDGFWDESAFDPDRTSQLERTRRHAVERTRTHHVVRREEPFEQLDDGSTMWLEPTPQIARRLGPLGAIDPRVLSIGAVVLAAVLAVPLFGALGGGGNGDELRAIDEQSTTTVSTIAPSTTSAADVVVVTAAVDTGNSGDTGASVAAVTTPAPPDAPDDATATDEAADEAAEAPEEPRALRRDPDCTNQYTAAAGDFWVRIADGVDTSLDSLLEVNEATADTPIYPGSTICLPDGAAAPIGFAAPDHDATSGGAVALATSPAQCANPYETAGGDYWLRLADAADIDLDALLELNGATADTPLYPGSIVCLPIGASGPTPTTATPSTAAPTTSPASTADVTTEPATTEPATTEPATTEPPTTVDATTPPATTEAPTTVPPAPPAPGEIEQIIRAAWPDDLEEQALRIAWRESNFNPRAQSSCCSGLFQIYYDVHAGWLADMGVHSVEDLYDPHLNAAAAYALYQRSGGWGPWASTAG